MREDERPAAAIQPAPFTAYQLDDAYDEMFTPDGPPLTQYAVLYRRLLEPTPAEPETGPPTARPDALRRLLRLRKAWGGRRPRCSTRPSTFAPSRSSPA